MVNRVQTLRSSAPGVLPQAGTRQPGELWLNFADFALGFIDASQTAQKILAVRWFVPTASYAVGDFVLNGGNLYRAIAPSSAGAFVAANWSKVGTAADLTAMQAYVDAGDAAATAVANTKLPLAGGTLTGPLILAADPTAALGATTKQYVDLRSGAVTVGATPPASPNPGALWWDSVGGQLYVWYDDGSTKQWVISVSAVSSASLPLSGGTLTGPLVLAADPTVALGAATKQYADAKTLGVTNGSDAPAGQIGEVISSNVASPGITLTSAVNANVTSISLSPGDWDVFGEVWLSVGGSAQTLCAAINTVSAAQPASSAVNTAYYRMQGANAGVFAGTIGVPLKPCRASLSTTTTYYLVAFCNFGTGTTTAAGNIWARRAR